MCCEHVCIMGMCMEVRTACGSWSSPSHLGGPRDWAQIVRCGGKDLYLSGPSHWPHWCFMLLGFCFFSRKKQKGFIFHKECDFGVVRWWSGLECLLCKPDKPECFILCLWGEEELTPESCFDIHMCIQHMCAHTHTIIINNNLIKNRIYIF